MKRISLSLSIILMFGACGVETSSSSKVVSAKTTDSVSDSNSSTVSDSNSSTVSDNNQTSSGNGDSVASSSNFDMKDATFDAQACSIDNGYRVISDSSFDPNATPDDSNGIEIESRYAYNSDVEATKIYIFYPDLTQEIKSHNVNVYSENYRFGFNEAWLANSNNIVYVRLAKNGVGHYACYRYELNSLTGTSVQSTKVYR